MCKIVYTTLLPQYLNTISIIVLYGKHKDNTGRHTGIYQELL